jgi:hypothetical protein
MKPPYLSWFERRLTVNHLEASKLPDAVKAVIVAEASAEAVAIVMASGPIPCSLSDTCVWQPLLRKQ